MMKTALLLLMAALCIFGAGCISPKEKAAKQLRESFAGSNSSINIQSLEVTTCKELSPTEYNEMDQRRRFERMYSLDRIATMIRPNLSFDSALAAANADHLYEYRAKVDILEAVRISDSADKAFLEQMAAGERSVSGMKYVRASIVYSYPGSETVKEESDFFIDEKGKIEDYKLPIPFEVRSNMELLRK